MLRWRSGTFHRRRCLQEAAPQQDPGQHQLQAHTAAGTPPPPQPPPPQHHDLFLYNRAYLRPDAPLPPPEALPDCPVDRKCTSKHVAIVGVAGRRHLPSSVCAFPCAPFLISPPFPPPPLPPPTPAADAVSGLDGIRAQRHAVLDAAASPLLRALPDYQRQFREHLLQANARHEASQQRCVLVCSPSHACIVPSACGGAPRRPELPTACRNLPPRCL